MKTYLATTPYEKEHAAKDLAVGPQPLTIPDNDQQSKYKRQRLNETAMINNNVWTQQNIHTQQKQLHFPTSSNHYHITFENANISGTINLNTSSSSTDK